jgi:hypothetical protein
MMRPMAATLRTQVLEQGDTQWVNNGADDGVAARQDRVALELVTKWTAASDWIVVGKRWRRTC